MEYRRHLKIILALPGPEQPIPIHLGTKEYPHIYGSIRSELPQVSGRDYRPRAHRHIPLAHDEVDCHRR